MPVEQMKNVGATAQAVVQKGAAATNQVANQVTTKVVDTAEKYSDVYTTLYDMYHSFMARVPYLIIALVVFMLFWLAARIFKLVLRRTLYKKAKGKQNLVLVMSRVGSSIIIFLGLMVSLVIALPNFTPSQLISMLGVGSVAIGFAFKDVLQNLLSGILLLWSDTIEIGDSISTTGAEGTVENVDVRATFIRTADGRRVIVPNSQLYTNIVTVNTAYKTRRISYDLNISYQEDIDRAKSIIMQVLKASSTVAQDQPMSVTVKNLSDASVTLNILWWIDTSTSITLAKSTDQVLSSVSKALISSGVVLPVPVNAQQAAAAPVVASANQPA